MTFTIKTKFAVGDLIYFMTPHGTIGCGNVSLINVGIPPDSQHPHINYHTTSNTLRDNYGTPEARCFASKAELIASL